jgi:hypothetical protein
MPKDKTLLEAEESLVGRIEELSFIINGLEHYGPYLKLIETFKDTRDKIDASWHLVMDLNKLNELRISKMAANSIISYVEDLKYDLERVQSELVTLRNPEQLIHKDYDPN